MHDPHFTRSASSQRADLGMHLATLPEAALDHSDPLKQSWGIPMTIAVVMVRGSLLGLGRCLPPRV
jgi:hypothetical protein